MTMAQTAAPEKSRPSSAAKAAAAGASSSATQAGPLASNPNSVQGRASQFQSQAGSLAVQANSKGGADALMEPDWDAAQDPDALMSPDFEGASEDPDGLMRPDLEGASEDPDGLMRPDGGAKSTEPGADDLMEPGAADAAGAADKDGLMEPDFRSTMDAPRGPGDRPKPKEVKLGGETGCVDVKSGTLNLRYAPSKSGKVLLKLAEGTVLTQHARVGNWLKVKVYSGHKGKEGWITKSAFRPEPDITLGGEEEDENRTPDDALVYKEVVGQPFIGQPTAADAEQGGIGDCFLIAAMGAVAEASPDVIKKMISPNKPSKSYTVTFYEVQDDGSYKPTSPIKVDAWFPTKNGMFQYTLMDTPTDPATRALWPAIVEKAYAQWQGGYDALDQGGWSGDAMSAMLGTASVPKDPQDYSPEELSAALKEAKEACKAICAYTPSKQAGQTEKAFSGSGKGSYSASLANEFEENSVSIVDDKGRAARVDDDAKGKLSGGGASGTLDYEKGDISVTWSDAKKAPGKAEDLTAK